MSNEAELAEGRVKPCLKCNSKLYFNWGFQVAYTPTNWEKTAFEGGPSKYGDAVKMEWVHVCAHCKTPYVLDESKLVDISQLVSDEEIMHGLAVLQGTPLGAKAAIMDP